MKKATMMFVALFAFVAFAAMPTASFACGEKAEKASTTQASAKSSCGDKAEKANATQASAKSSCGDKAEKANATQASAKSSCASKTDATMASDKAACASKTDATMASDKAACASKTDATMASDKAACASKTGADMAKADGTCGGKYELVSMNISGMTCGGCEKSVTAALVKMEGVQSVKKVCSQSGVALVYVDPAKMKDKNVMTTAVANKGFSAEIIPAVATSSDAKMVDGKNCTAEQKAACASMTAEQKAACAAACASKKASTTEAKTVSAEGTN